MSVPSGVSTYTAFFNFSVEFETFTYWRGRFQWVRVSIVINVVSLQVVYVVTELNPGTNTDTTGSGMSMEGVFSAHFRPQE